MSEGTASGDGLRRMAPPAPGEVWRSSRGEEVTIREGVKPFPMQDENGEWFDIDSVRVADPRDGEEHYGGSYIALSALSTYTRLSELPGSSPHPETDARADQENE